ncbi:hypothetical protein V6N11_058373 [Hibiscus sabdariffa]|uniref:Reverse transcriptase zinc-binding domain-containing protein n=1 Tax=Hibiscus sabdariffa TaxID=183260 RepID=A0ABR2U439_9ROSI
MLVSCWDPSRDIVANIANFNSKVGAWNRDVFGHIIHEKRYTFLPPSLVLRIAAIKPPCESSLNGVPAWLWDPFRSFSVHSAYLSLADGDAVSYDKGWSIIANFKGPPRVRTFLWLVYWERILTNHERVRRAIASDAGCFSCGATLEDTLHVLRDCPVVVGIWSWLSNRSCLAECSESRGVGSRFMLIGLRAMLMGPFGPRLMASVGIGLWKSNSSSERS